MKKVFITVLLLATFPCVAFANVTITEVAWMGTVNSQFEEWVELYNDTGAEISLSGWKLFKTGGITLYSLTGSIPADGYYVVCRTTASLTNPMSGLCDEQGQWGGSGLNNTSDQAVLKDESGTAIDTADGAGGWPAGDSASKQTMQKSGSGWVTAEPTPGLAATASNEENPDEEEENEEDPDDTNNEEEKLKDKKKNSKETIRKIKPDPKYEAHVIIPDYGIAGISVPIKAEVKKDKMMNSISGKYEWSTGDGASYVFKKNEAISHVYEYPGTYTIMLAYYSNRLESEPDTIHSKQIVIAPATVSILGTTNDGGVILKNDSTKDIDLDRWIISSQGSQFVFPPRTMIAKGSELSVSSKTIAIALDPNSITLLNPDHELISHYPVKITSDHLDKSNNESLPEEIQDDTKQSQSILGAQTASADFFSKEWLQKYGWYLGFGAFAVIIAVAYFVTRLYSLRSEILEEEEGMDEML